jgi:anti-anti-sigma factor
MPLASLKLEVQGSVVYAEVRGDIDMSNAADLREELSRMTPNDALGLVLDLRDLNYLDSSGIHMLHHLREDLRIAGQKLQLVIAEGSPVNHALRLAGIDWGEEISTTPHMGPCLSGTRRTRLARPPEPERW